MTGGLRGWRLALAGSVGFLAVYAVAVLTPAGQRWENDLFERTRLPAPEVWELQGAMRWVGPWVQLGVVGGLLLWLAARVVWSRWRDGMPDRDAPLRDDVAWGVGEGVVRQQRALATLAGATVACVGLIGGVQLLKATLPRPMLDDPWLWWNTLPSGHTAGAAAVGLAVFFVVPRSWRPTALLLTLMLAAAMGRAVMALSYHRLSDVVCSALLALVCLGVGLEVERAVDRRLRRVS